MTTAEKPLSELVQELSLEQQNRVRSYIAGLLQQGAPPARPLRQSWAGALRDLRDQMTSVELQHRAMDWMAESGLRRAGGDVPR
jgi:hypothetical protein